MALNILYTPFWQTDRLDVISLMHSIYIVCLELVVKNTSFRGCVFTKKSLANQNVLAHKAFWRIIVFFAQVEPMVLLVHSFLLRWLEDLVL